MTARFAALVLTAPPPGASHEINSASVKIDGREALLRSVELFLNREPIQQVIVVFQPETLEEGKKKHGGHFGFTGVRVVGGGPKWLEQVAAAMPLLPADATHIILHDAARPAVPYTDLEVLLDAADAHEAVVLTAALRAPLLELDEGGQPVGYRSGNEFTQLLTPQVFSRAKLLKCLQQHAMPHAAELHAIAGSPLNVRINSAADASLLKALIAQLPKPKIKATNNPFEEAQW